MASKFVIHLFAQGSDPLNGDSMKTLRIPLLALVLGVVGVLAGHSLRSFLYTAQTTPSNSISPLLKTALDTGDHFPPVELVDLNGNRHGTSELLRDKGGVVLFLDPACAPCVDTSVRWQQLIDEGLIAADRVIAITVQKRDVLVKFVDDHSLSFSMFLDESYEFMLEYDVKRFPIEMIVDASGVIQEIGQDLIPPTL